ncbi:unnamed protein product [Vitrella brassicaformis CCMP3155]|uniref:Uncharacterized protein n=2 Tax=Vitrella brassicaformis TaxID=1169539 RepID=A0A0G4GIT8_VITBC|nr:unnamed protein product [Vitrella brassicaformis CCMP3155]|eukprot:CEM29755.1 unnamed protein product [Vitrella brassicaformis CCMP3155]
MYYGHPTGPVGPPSAAPAALPPVAPSSPPGMAYRGSVMMRGGRVEGYRALVVSPEDLALLPASHAERYQQMGVMPSSFALSLPSSPKKTYAGGLDYQDIELAPPQDVFVQTLDGRTLKRIPPSKLDAVLQAGADVGDRPAEDTSPITRFIARHPLFYSLSSIKAALCNPQMQQLKEDDAEECSVLEYCALFERIEAAADAVITGFQGILMGLGICALWLWCLSPTGWEYRERCRFFEPYLSRAIFLLANICLTGACVRAIRIHRQVGGYLAEQSAVTVPNAFLDPRMFKVMILIAANACEVLVSVLATPLDNLLLNDPTNKKLLLTRAEEYRVWSACSLTRTFVPIIAWFFCQIDLLAFIHFPLPRRFIPSLFTLLSRRLQRREDEAAKRPTHRMREDNRIQQDGGSAYGGSGSSAAGTWRSRAVEVPTVRGSEASFMPSPRKM